MDMLADEIATVSGAPVNATAKALALLIMALHDEDGLSYMEIEDLAAYAEVSTRTVERALHDLVGAKVITNLDPDPNDSAALYFVCGARADGLRIAPRAA